MQDKKDNFLNPCKDIHYLGFIWILIGSSIIHIE